MENLSLALRGIWGGVGRALQGGGVVWRTVEFLHNILVQNNLLDFIVLLCFNGLNA